MLMDVETASCTARLTGLWCFMGALNTDVHGYQVLRGLRNVWFRAGGGAEDRMHLLHVQESCRARRDPHQVCRSKNAVPL
jgi:hypothetical protein